MENNEANVEGQEKGEVGVGDRKKSRGAIAVKDAEVLRFMAMSMDIGADPIFSNSANVANV